jgi:hypothetical protein
MTRRTCGVGPPSGRAPTDLGRKMARSVWRPWVGIRRICPGVRETIPRTRNSSRSKSGEVLRHAEGGVGKAGVQTDRPGYTGAISYGGPEDTTERRDHGGAAK